MKKSMLVLTAALMFGGLASAQTSATASAPQVPALTDVPAGHWAKDAIDRLVSRGILLGYPDGTFRGTQNLTRYEAAVIIARLLEQMAAGTAPVVAGDDLVALQNAVQELAADLAALGVRVSDLEENAVSKDDFSRLEARVEELAGNQGDAEAVATLQAQIDDLTARADEYDTLRADVDDNASSIAALNDLTVLLNQDILDLQDRVSAVEAAQADFVTRADFDNLSTRVTGIDTRVATLEKAPKFGVSGTISASYGAIRLTSGTTAFDVDRLTRQTFADNVFSNGRIHCYNDTWTTAGNPVGCTDTDINYTRRNSYLTFGVKATNLTTADGKVVVNNAQVNFYTKGSDLLQGSNDIGTYINNVSLDGTLNGQKFTVRYEPYGSEFKFGDYLFANDNYKANGDAGIGLRGIVATIEADQLPLKPKLTIVAGNATPFEAGALNTLAGNYYGLRASMNPGNLGTFGVSYAQMDGGTYTFGTTTTTTAGRSALGVDFDLGFGVKNAEGNSPFTLKGEAVGSMPNSGLATGTTPQDAFGSLQSASYVEAKADLNVVKLGANYRAINPAYADGEASMSVNYAPYYPGTVLNGYPYGADQIGFGGAVSTNLGPISVAGYADSMTDWVGAGRETNFGVAAGVKFFGLSALGFYNKSTGTDEDGTFSQHIGSNFGYNYKPYNMYMDVAYVPMMWSSTYGAQLSHDGKASDALVKNLNFTAAYARFYDDGINDIQVYGDYTGTFAGITIAPFARYHMFSVPGDRPVDYQGDNAGNNTSGVNQAVNDARSYNAFKYGVKLSTQPFASVPLQPSLFGNFAQRTSTAKNPANILPATNSATYAPETASETFAQVGVTLNQAFVPNLKASLGYAYYAAKNVGGMQTAQSASGATATYSPIADRFYRSPLGGASDPYTGGNFGAVSGNLNGIFAQVDWNGLQANYGIFKYNETSMASGAAVSKNSVAQGFKVSYTFKF